MIFIENNRYHSAQRLRPMSRIRSRLDLDGLGLFFIKRHRFHYPNQCQLQENDYIHPRFTLYVDSYQQGS